MRRLPRLLCWWCRGLLALASLVLALANGAGYLWSAAWTADPRLAWAAAYLPLFFGLAWVLALRLRACRWAPAVLGGLSALALAVCLWGWWRPEAFPLRIILPDLLVAAGLATLAWSCRPEAGPKIGPGAGDPSPQDRAGPTEAG